MDGPLDHSTGKGWVKDHAYGKGWVKTDTGWKWRGAQYYDAKWVKKAITKNESGRTGAPGGRKGELRDRGLCQSAPVRALVVPVCCERGLYFKNWRLWRLRRLCSVMAGGGGYFEITPFLPIFGHPSKYLKI